MHTAEGWNFQPSVVCWGLSMEEIMNFGYNEILEECLDLLNENVYFPDINQTEYLEKIEEAQNRILGWKNLLHNEQVKELIIKLCKNHKAQLVDDNNQPISVDRYDDWYDRLKNGKLNFYIFFNDVDEDELIIENLPATKLDLCFDALHIRKMFCLRKRKENSDGNSN